MRGVAVELRRLWSRRLVKVAAVIAGAALVIAAAIVVYNARQNEASASGVPIHSRGERRELRLCLRGRFGPVPDDPSEARAFCESQLGAQDPRLSATAATGAIAGVTVPLMILLWVIGASFIGAEWHHGTMTTQLTWEPRRIRVMVTKLAAIVLFAWVAALVVQAFVAWIVLGAATFFGTTAGADGAWFQGLVWEALRISSLTSLGAAMGFSIAAIGRNTAAALGAGFAYLAVVETLLRTVRPHWQPWFLSDNAAIFVAWQEDLISGVSHSPGTAALVVVAYTAAVAAIAFILFQTRDVT